MTDRLGNLKITPKLYLAIVGLVLILVVSLGLVTYITGQRALYNAIIQDLSSNTLEKETAFFRWVHSGQEHVMAIAGSPNLRNNVQQFIQGGDLPEAQLTVNILDELEIWTEWEDTFESFMVIDAESGQVLISTNALEIGQFKENRNYFQSGRTESFFEYPFYSVSANTIVTVASAPILSNDGELLAVLAGRMRMNTVAEIIHQRTGGLSSEEALLVNRANLLVIDPITDNTLRPFVSTIRTEIVNTCLAGESGKIIATDYRDVRVIAVRRWLPEAQLCLIVKVDEQEALQPVRQLGQSILAISLLALAIGTGLSLAIARTITGPVENLVEGIHQVRQGNLDHVIAYRGGDEIAILTQAFNEMTAERKRIARNRDRLLNILEATPDFVATADMEGNLLYANAAARRILGVDPDVPLTGWKIPDTHPVESQIIVAEEGIPTAVREGTWIGETALYRADGQIMPVSQVIVAHRESDLGTQHLSGEDDSIHYLSTIARDLTQRREIELALVRARDELELRVQERTADLAESEMRYRLLASNFPDGVVLLFDLDLSYRIAGGQKLEEMGISAKETEGHTLFQVFPPDEHERLERTYRNALEGKVTQHETWKQGRIYTELTLPVRNNMGEIAGGMVLIQDITGRREMETALAEKAIELARSNADLEQVSYVSAHNLQEPLRKIRTFSDWITRKHQDSSLLDERSREYLARISASAGDMQQLLDDMLIYSRISIPDQKENMVVLNDLVTVVLDELSRHMDTKDAQIQVDPLPTLYAQEQQMKMLFSNLLSNAIKFRKPDVPLSIHIRSEMIHDDQWCQVHIEDNGIGFDEKYLDRIFVTFQRLYRMGEYSGTGMGLAICRRIVEQHDGQLTARSEVGKGSTFTLMLPLQSDRQRDTPDSVDLPELIDNFQKEYNSVYESRSLETGWKRYV